MWPSWSVIMNRSRVVVLSHILFEVFWSIFHTFVLILVLNLSTKAMGVFYILNLIWIRRKTRKGLLKELCGKKMAHLSARASGCLFFKHLYLSLNIVEVHILKNNVVPCRRVEAWRSIMDYHHFWGLISQIPWNTVAYENPATKIIIFSFFVLNLACNDS